MPMIGKIRPAQPGDAEGIFRLIQQYVREEILLVKTQEEITSEIPDFVVCEHEGLIHGCAMLKKGWGPLAEIRSLAVSESLQGQGAGSAMVKALLAKAKAEKVNNVFVLTYKADFFRHLGFKEVSKELLPEKVWSDCVRCPKFYNCKEIALIYHIEKEGMTS